MRAAPRALGALALLALAAAACERERRPLELSPAANARSRAVRQSTLQPGPARPDAALRDPYAGNAYGMAQGKRLFSWYNCVGCHAHGGGGMGPPLMDDQWIYGADPENVFQTIVGGRPNGMPSFGGKLPDHQVWQLVAYVRSLSGLAPKDASPGRDDGIWSRPSEQSKSEEEPRPDRAEHPR